MSPIGICKRLLLCTLACLLPLQAPGTAAQQEHPRSIDASIGTDAKHQTQPTMTDLAPEASGGRGAQHCALAIGVILGGAIGFWANPFLGTNVMRFGLMATVLHC